MATIPAHRNTPDSLQALASPRQTPLKIARTMARRGEWRSLSEKVTSASAIAPNAIRKMSSMAARDWT